MASAQQGVEEYSIPGIYTFTVPDGVTEITVEAWGAGGRGGDVEGQGQVRGAGGGGGGAYARSVFAVTSGNDYQLTVGAGSESAEPGEDSEFQGPILVLAKGGDSVDTNDQAGATGGLASDSEGNDVTYAGGNGAGRTGDDGGGGGSSAGPAADGNTASGTAGADAPPGGGDGGDGGSRGSGQLDGSPGTQPGGGGGGATGPRPGGGSGGGQGGGPPSSVSQDGGAGADGLIRITYQVPSVDHYAFAVGAGTASTCHPRTIAITAEYSTNAPVADYTAAVDLATSSAHGTWSVSAADGTLTDATADDGAASYQFVDSDNGTVELNLSNQHADDLTITVTEDDGSPSSTSATLSFRDNVFVIESDDSLGDDVVAGRDHDLQVSLWRRDPSTGECAIADAYNDAAQGVKLWLGRHADDPNGAAPDATGVTTASLPDSAPGSNNIILDFSAGTLGQAGRAPLTLATTDVARYALQIRDDTSGFAQDPAGNPLAIGGGSSDFVVRPFGFDVSASGNPGAQDANGTAYRAGGEDFDVTVTAVQWQSADDNNGDGVPDGHGDADPVNNADLSDNAATPSFGQEGTPESVDVTAALWRPAGQNDPGLAGGSPLVFSGFSGGAATQTTFWNEVGILELESVLADGDYLASGQNVSGRSGPVGRFHPDRLRVTAVTSPAFRDGTGMWGSPFTYMGQDFTFGAASLPQVQVEALSADGTTVLMNYGGEGAGADADFWRLIGTPARSYSDGTSAIDAVFDPDPSTGSVTWNLGTGDTRADYDGRGTFEVSGDRFAYDRIDAATRQPPFDALVGLQLAAGDLDDGEACHDPDGNGTCDPFTIEDITGTELRYGRLVVDSVGGSELAPVRMPARVEYWTASGWAVNVEDGDTELSIAAEVALTNERGTNSDVTKVPGNLEIELADAPNGGTTQIEEPDGAITMGETAGGEAVLTFAAPGPGNTGWAAAIPRLESEHPYLRYDWATDDNQDQVLDDDPRARATFGIYGGDDAWIHLRRVPVN